jgi:hypothetical protein
MLTPQEIVDNLSADEFIELVQIVGQRKFDVVSISRDEYNEPIVFVKTDGLERAYFFTQVRLWQHSA